MGRYPWAGLPIGSRVGQGDPSAGSRTGATRRPTAADARAALPQPGGRTGSDPRAIRPDAAGWETARPPARADVTGSLEAPRFPSARLLLRGSERIPDGRGNGGERHGEHGEHLGRPAAETVFGSKESVERARTSHRPTPAACTLTSPSPTPGSGRGTLSNVITVGGPNACTNHAVIVARYASRIGVSGAMLLALLFAMRECLSWHPKGRSAGPREPGVSRRPPDRRVGDRSPRRSRPHRDRPCAR